MYTVDASVWINGFDRSEAGHEISRQFLELLHSQADPVFLPNLACVEVAGAIARTRGASERAQEFATALSRLPNVTLLALDDELAGQAQALAADHALRGADAVYAAVALSSGCTLVSLDREHLTRLNGVVAVSTPAAILDAVDIRVEEDKDPAEAEPEADSPGLHVEDDRATAEAEEETDSPGLQAQDDKAPAEAGEKASAPGHEATEGPPESVSESDDGGASSDSPPRGG